jgi:hypothetical protein
MSRIDDLLSNYRRLCGLPWDANIAGPQRVWLAIYDKEDERKLRARMPSFEEATRATGHGWHTADLTDAFARWLATSTYKSFAPSYFSVPSRLGAGPLNAFRQSVADWITSTLNGLSDPHNTVLAVTGVGGLFGFVQLSDVLPLVDPHILGRLLVFFPGSYTPNNYRLFDARDGWNYLATPILAGEPEPRG